MSHQEFLRQLPTECQGLTIEPRHKVALQPYFMKDGVWVVLLTDQPEQADKAWRLTWPEWREIEPKHETKVRYVRERLEPTFVGTPNPPNPRRPLQLFLF